MCRDFEQKRKKKEKKKKKRKNGTEGLCERKVRGQ